MISRQVVLLGTCVSLVVALSDAFVAGPPGLVVAPPASSHPTGRSRRCRGRGHGHGATMASSVAPAPRTKAEKKSEHFRLKDGGMVEFGSGQRVEVRSFGRSGGCRGEQVGWCV